jgi:hypothetical protein
MFLAAVQQAAPPGFPWDSVIAAAVGGLLVMMVGFVLHRLGAWARLLSIWTDRQSRTLHKSFEHVTGEVWETYVRRIEQLEQQLRAKDSEIALLRAHSEGQQKQIDVLTSLVGAEAHAAVKQLVEEVRGYRQDVLAWRGA